MQERIGTNAENLLAKAAAGERLTYEEGVFLYQNADFLALGRAADLVRRRLHPEGVVTFVVGRNINYTNICQCGCRFCAFYRKPDHPQAYLLTLEEIFAKIEDTIVQEGTELLIQGGLHPDLDLDYYLRLLTAIKKRYPLHLHSFSPPEVAHMARKSGLSIRETLVRLKAAGLDSLPGGGAEILVDRVRRLVSPRKITAAQWLEVMRQAHRLGLKSSATMVLGHLETASERVLHMVRVRELQDETGGFTAFIPWTYAPGNTALGGPGATAVDYLRTLALARLMLDNIPNIQVSWVTQGIKLAQVALSFGGNDFGSTMLEENVVRAAGVSCRASRAEIIRHIKDAGFVPAQRTTLYHVLRTF